MGSLADRLLTDFHRQWRSQSRCIVAHTSGSTGVPKAIHLRKSDMELSARATCERFGIDAGSTLYLPLSLSYIAGKMMVVRAMVSGARLIIEEPSSRPQPHLFLSDSPSDCIDLAAIVPAQIDALLASPAAGRIKSVIVGGAPLSPMQEQQLQSAPFEAYATYGMTETCSHVALRSLRDPSEPFRAMPGITFATDHRSCLVINAPRYSFRRLVTNDVVHLLDDTSMRWIGRADNVINSGGIKLYPEEMERRISALLPAGVEIKVTSRPSERWGTEAVLQIANYDGDIALLLDTIKHHLGSRHSPRAILPVPSIPRRLKGMR